MTRRERRQRVAIIHPWFPQYRREFFAQLIKKCELVGIDLEIFYGSPPPEWRERGDSVTMPGTTELPTRFFNLRGRSLAWKRLSAFNARGPFDLIILEQAIRNLESYWILLRFGSNRVAWWGHGRTYTAAKANWEERLKRSLTKRGRWFFAYTKLGGAAVEDAGFPPDRITVVNNSTDTRALQLATEAVLEEEVETFRVRHALTDDVVVYMGGLDESKRIPFLLSSMTKAHRDHPHLRLLVIGSGPERALVEDFAAANPWCVYLGSLFGEERAQALRSAKLMVVPGRVGLAAVDSFAARVPIVTTDWPFHAPEFEYLRDGVNAVVASDNQDRFADAAVAVLRDDALLNSLRAGCAESAQTYTVERMVDNFERGLVSALANSAGGENA